MSNYIICTDSTCDLPESYYKEHEIPVVSLSYTIRGETYPDNSTSKINKKEFYDMLRAGDMSSTSQINAEDFIAIIEPLVKQGNDILFIAFSSALSGSYQSCQIGADELSEKYPQRKIIVIDSLCASMGEGLLLNYALQNQKSGMSLDENAKWVEENKLKLCHWFTVDSLNHLHRMGRVSKASAVLGGLIGIKPVLNVSDEGKLIFKAKVRGRPAAIKMLVEKMAQYAVNPKQQTIFISHGDCLDEAKLLAKMVRNKFGIKQDMIHYVGAVIGSHSGPGTLALFFIGTERA
ncbi:MAG: DegV family protein [Oscillospiraceae bacterium]|jgi:DegV family protein with EDD domain|nr:DegV family protein [Oscillospiraceae bacterium]